MHPRVFDLRVFPGKRERAWLVPGLVNVFANEGGRSPRLEGHDDDETVVAVKTPAAARPSTPGAG